MIFEAADRRIHNWVDEMSLDFCQSGTCASHQRAHRRRDLSGSPANISPAPLLIQRRGEVLETWESMHQKSDPLHSAQGVYFSSNFSS